MNKRVWWVLGEQQAGKTHFARLFATYGADVLHIGETLRLKTAANAFAAESNPYAAPSVETEVHAMIKQHLADFNKSDKTLLLIDSAPKTVEQFALLDYSFIQFGFMDTIIVIREEYDERKRRAQIRYTNGMLLPDLTLFNSRERFEQEWLDLVPAICIANDTDIMIFDKRIKHD